MPHRFGALVLWCFAFCGAAVTAAPVAPAHPLEGKVRLGEGSAFLLETARGTVPVILQEHTVLQGMCGGAHLAPGDEVAVDAERIEASLVYARAVRRAPEPALGGRRLVAPAEMDALLAERGRARAVLVDCRPVEAFLRGHIPGSVSLGSAEGASATKDKEKTVILVGGDRYGREVLPLFQEMVLGGSLETRVLAGGVEGWNLSGRRLDVDPRGVPQPLPPPWEWVVVDVRTPEEFAGGHIPGAFTVPLDAMRWENFARMSGMPTLLFYGGGVGDGRASDAAAKALGWRYQKGVSLNAPVGVLSGGVEGWKAAGLPLRPGPADAVYGPDAVRRPEEVSLAEWTELCASGEELVVDLRRREDPRPEHAVHLPLEELPARMGELPKERPLVLFCSMGVRAQIGYEILRRNGYRVRYLRDALAP